MGWIKSRAAIRGRMPTARKRDGMEEPGQTGPLRGQSAIGVAQSATAGKLLGQSAIESSSTTARGLRAQSATEALVLAGFAAVFMLPLVLLFLSTSRLDGHYDGLAQAQAWSES